MLGIGLGGFAKGLDTGIGIGKKLDKHFQEKKEREAFEGAVDAGQADYDAAVASGEATAGDPEGPLRYAMPRIVQPLLTSGDLKGAEAAASWVRSDKTKQGSRLFANGMLKGQNGDIQGALKDFVAAGRVQGYGADFEIGGPEPLEGGGFRVNVKDKDGNERSQVFKTPDEVMQFGATYLNPESAFKQWQEGQKAKSEYARDVRKEGDKERAKLSAKTEDEVVRKNLGIGVSAKPSDIVSARKQAQAELQAGDSFLDSTPTQQAQMIEQRAREILGGGNAPGVTGGRKVIVDTKTGKLVGAAQ